MAAMVIPCLFGMVLMAWSSAVAAENQGVEILAAAGSFALPEGRAWSPDASVEGLGSHRVRWGEPTELNGLRSAVAVDLQRVQGELGDWLPVGFLSVSNGETRDGTVIDAIDLELELSWLAPGVGTSQHRLRLAIETTPNFSDGKASADSIRLLQPHGDVSLDVNGVTRVHGIRVRFGEGGGLSQGGATEWDKLFVLEGATARVPLEIKVSEIEPLAIWPLELTFEDVGGDSELVATGEGSARLVSGEPSSSASLPASEYVLEGHHNEEEAWFTERRMTLGELHFYNGSARVGTAAHSASIRIRWSHGLVMDFPIGFVNTPNQNDVRASADEVTLRSMAAPDKLVDDQGRRYHARLSFGSASAGGHASPEVFAVEEGVSAKADLILVLSGIAPPRRPFQVRLSPGPGNSPWLFAWPSVPGHLYELQVSEDLREFETLGDPVIAVDSTTLLERFILEGPTRFFRLVDFE